ncbi:hypothetical protein [Massilia sp. DWR3-1-1]|uniref:hypothetical protein n=1 Tax=Massilia sp. DWR3-1-1 TaxID=2804559 RepID=UPI003CFA5D48
MTRAQLRRQDWLSGALVNHAGITGRIGVFMNTDPAIIEQVFRINVPGTMH